MAKKLNTLSLNELAERGNRFVLVAVDETHHWDEDIARKAKKIEGVYLVDLTKPTHLCELSVSYFAVFISNYFNDTEAWRDSEGELIGDELDELERNNGGEDGSYFSGRSVFDIKKRYRTGQLEDVEEYERCNPTYC